MRRLKFLSNHRWFNTSERETSTSKYCRMLDKQRKQLSKIHTNRILYLCHKIQFIEPDIVNFLDPHKKYSNTKQINVNMPPFPEKFFRTMYEYQLLVSYKHIKVAHINTSIQWVQYQTYTIEPFPH